MIRGKGLIIVLAFFGGVVLEAEALLGVTIFQKDGTVVEGKVLRVGSDRIKLKSVFGIISPPDDAGESTIGLITIHRDEIDRIEWQDGEEKSRFRKQVARMMQRQGEEEQMTWQEPREKIQYQAGLELISLFGVGVGALNFGNRDLWEFEDVALGGRSELEFLLNGSGGLGVAWRKSIALSIEYSYVRGLMGIWESNTENGERAKVTADMRDLNLKFWFLGKHMTPFVLVGKSVRHRLEIETGGLVSHFSAEIGDFHFGAGVLLGKMVDNSLCGLNIEILLRPHSFTHIDWLESSSDGGFPVSLSGDSVSLMLSFAYAHFLF